MPLAFKDSRLSADTNVHLLHLKVLPSTCDRITVAAGAAAGRYVTYQNYRAGVDQLTYTNRAEPKAHLNVSQLYSTVPELYLWSQVSIPGTVRAGCRCHPDDTISADSHSIGLNCHHSLRGTNSACLL